MKIGIDFDSTIAKIDQPLLDRLNAVRGTNYRAEDWSDWKLTFLQPEDRELLFQYFTPDIYDTVVPYPCAPEAIHALAQIPGIDLLCVTSNPSQNSEAFTEAKEAWLRKYIPALSGTVIAAKDKFGLGLDILVDDAPHHHAASDCTTVLVKRPWNKAVHCPYEFSGWQDGQRLLQQLIQNPNR